ncbi:type I-B CRISPR-associated protein Cas5b [Kurthia sibirica]|uniref:Type I-B CRISPR-associated protein Cas5 n=1 Tax=Kurthia sibirica TaxID=202750 RepID=A0A2U3AJ37_9BACL|nr:type I-B CRISPR-associated protein Cas5b [Kurthia sibirica]PWI24481.1 type I-B CRISPR-associated protein Cas5 [Kurthia sibirica]GEK35338.1 type I-B CRISPR-associated protein Cas5 [Kurthia sibirica]
MKLLKIKIFQETACYLKPFAFKVGETYPLVPFSTIKGMLHAVLHAKEYIPMKISIQGQYESIFIDYQKKYMYKKREVPALLITSGLKESVEFDKNLVTTMPMYQHLLFNVEHVIHVEAEEAILEQLHHNLHHLDTTLSLGRWEDLVRIDEVEFTEISKGKVNATRFTQYIPIEQKEDYELGLNNPFYRLPRKYEIVRGRREWDYIETMLIPKGTEIEDEKTVFDDEGLPIFLLEG